MSDKYRCIGQHDNANDALYEAVKMIAGSPKSLQAFRKVMGSTYFEESGKWVDTNAVHDLLKAFNAVKSERASRPECCG